MSKKDKRKKDRGPLTPRKKDNAIASFAAGELDIPPQFFGFSTPSKGGAAVFFDDEDCQCMATEVRADDIESLAARGVAAHPGDWVISSGGHDSPGGIMIHGPFKTMDEAFAAGAETYGVIRWTSPIQAL